MRILIFHGRLAHLTGGEVNTRDWALGFKARGHKVVVFTVGPGPLAAQIHDAGIAVVDDPAAISDPPDIIFGAGVNDVAAAVARFPDAPAIQVAQVWDHWNNYPSPLPQVVLHVAVDDLNAEMLVNEFGVPRARVRIVHNAVDMSRMPPRTAALPARPARALVFVKEDRGHLDAVRAACAARGIAANFIGYPTGKPVEDPLAAMAAYDLVVGTARTALEGAVAGAAVLVADQRGLAGMLTTANFPRFRTHNFGRELLTRPFDAETIGAEIDRYDPADAAAVSRLARQDAPLERQLERLEDVFAEAIKLFRDAPPTAEESRRALSAYLARHLPRPAEGDPSPRHNRFFQQGGRSLEDRIVAAEKEISRVAVVAAATAEQLEAARTQLSAGMAQPADAKAQLADSAAQLAEAGAQLSALRQRLGTIERSVGEIQAMIQRNSPLIRLLRPLALAIRRLRF